MAKSILKPIIKQTDLVAIVNKVLSCANALGASSAEASLSTASGFSVQVRMGEVETLEYHDDKDLSVTVFCGQSQGTAGTTDLQEESIKATVEKAFNIAKYTEADPFAGLPDKALMAFDYPDLDLYYPWNIKPEEAIEIAVACEGRARSTDRRIINSDGVSFNTQTIDSIYGNSYGFMGECASTSHQISCALVASEHSNMQRDYSYTIARDAHDLWSINTLADAAVERTLKRLQPQSLTTRSAPVIFEADAARGLIGHFVAAMRGSALYRQASFLVGQLGKTIFPSWMQIEEQPHLLKALGSMPFDSDGVATKAKHFVKDGVLINYALGTYSARKLNMPNTGNSSGVHNLIVSHSQEDFITLLKRMGTGLVVTELMGQGINLITGDYSRGASGFWVENGMIQYPVHQITIAGNLKDMFANIVAVADDVDIRGNVRTGSILIEKMMIAGQ